MGMEYKAETKRIARNTIMLYVRQIVILFVNLFSMRIVLNTLGVEDYGIYSVVGGIVTFFSFLSGTMASATQRFFSYTIGENNIIKLKKIFSTNLIIYILMSVIAVVLLETFGIWFVEKKLNVPINRLVAAKYVFHFSVINFVFTITTSPFMAIVIAHEDIRIYAWVSIFDSFFKLAIVYLLRIFLGDKLITYGIMLCGIGIINFIVYVLFCVKKYEECQFKNFYWDKDLFNETLKFTGWTLFGQATTVIRTQAVTVLLNQIFNPIVVSARTIATQVANYINIFSTNFNTGLYPPIIKTYAAGDKEKMFDLVFNGCRITFFLMWIFALPLFFTMDIVLKLWLKVPPEGAVLFTRLALVEVLINAISLPITTAARAPGKMKTYELSLGSIQILIFVIDLLLFKIFKVPAYTVFIVAALGNLFMLFVRLLVVHSLIDLSIVNFVKKVLLPVIEVMFISLFFSFVFYLFLKKTLIFSLILLMVIFIINLIFIFFLGLNREERNVVVSKIKKNRMKA